MQVSIVLKNSVFVLSEKLISILLVVAFSSALAKNVSQGDFGYYNYIISIFQLFTFISLMGLETSIIRSFVDKDNDPSDVFWAGLAIKVLGAVAAFISVILYFYINDEHDDLLVLYSLSYFFQILYFIEYFYLARYAYVSVFKYKIVILLSVCFIKITILLLGGGIYEVVLVDVFGFAVIGLSYLYVFKGNINKPSLYSIKHEFLCLIKPSAKIILSSLFIMIFTKIDQIMITKISGAEENAIYSASNNIFMGLLVFPAVISSVLYPYIVSKSNEKEINFAVRLQLEFLVMASFLFIAAGFFWGKYFIDLVYGDAYNRSAEIFSIQMLSILFVSLGIGSNKWLIVRGLHNHLIYRAVLAAISNIILNFALIPTYGALGAAVASLFAHIVSGFLANSLGAKTKEIFLIQTYALIPVLSFKKAIGYSGGRD